MRNTKIKNFCSSSLWTCLHHMVTLGSQNKITDLFTILAWDFPFNSKEGSTAGYLCTVVWLIDIYIITYFISDWQWSILWQAYIVITIECLVGIDFSCNVSSIPLCKAKGQYLLTLQVSRYCILALQSNEQSCGACRLIEISTAHPLSPSRQTYHSPSTNRSCTTDQYI